MTYLVIRFSTVGSVAMLYPLILSLSAHYPHDKFVVVSESLQALFGNMPNVDFVDAKAEKGRWKTTRMWSLSKKLKRDYDIDYVVDLQDSRASQFLRRLLWSSCKEVVVMKKHRKRRELLIKQGYAQSEPLLTEFELYRDAFAEVGLEAKFDFDVLPHDKEADLRINLLFGNKPAEEKWIGIAPFAKHKTNMLPYKLLKTVISDLSKRQQTKIFLFGAGEIENEILNQWASVYDNTYSISGKYSLKEELSLMRQLDLMVCMDSANQHFASLVGLRALTIWCGTHPYAGFYGWKQSPEDCMQKELPCRPCTLHGKEKCRLGTFECQDFSADEIIKRADQCLNKQELN